MAKHTGKGRQRRASTLEGKATQHKQFIGQADAERAEAELHKRQHLEEDVVQEMNAELQHLADKGDGSAGPEIPFRIPRSIEEGKRIIQEAPEALRERVEEGKRLIREAPEAIREKVDEGKRRLSQAPDALREKARQRLSELPAPAQKALEVAEAAFQVLLTPARMTYHVVREVLRVPGASARALRQKEA